jgi:2-haloacid dehalogenase
MSIRVVVFDVFGTCVDWRGSLIAMFERFGARHGRAADWAGLVDAWRGRYQPQMEECRAGRRPWTPLDTLHRESLDALLPQFGLPDLAEGERAELNLGWHRLDPWPDAVSGLAALKRAYVIGPLSNGNFALLTNLAKHAGLPWDAIFSVELFRAYKPQPAAYLGVAALMNVAPASVMLCAAHNDDLAAARACGLATAFVPRPTEYGPRQASDLEPSAEWDVVARNFVELAAKVGRSAGGRMR